MIFVITGIFTVPMNVNDSDGQRAEDNYYEEPLPRRNVGEMPSGKESMYKKNEGRANSRISPAIVDLPPICIYLDLLHLSDFYGTFIYISEEELGDRYRD